MKRHLSLLVFLPVVLGLELLSTNPNGPPIVDLGYAQYQGASNVDTGNTEFLGIRFAAPPTGMIIVSPLRPRNC